MVKFTEFVRKHYQAIILLAVAAGLLLGVWSTAPGKAIQPYSQALPFLMILYQFDHYAAPVCSGNTPTLGGHRGIIVEFPLYAPGVLGAGAPQEQPMMSLNQSFSLTGFFPQSKEQFDR